MARFQFLIGTIKTIPKVTGSPKVNLVSIPYRYYKNLFLLLLLSFREFVSIPYRYYKNFYAGFIPLASNQFQFLIGTIKTGYM